MRSGEERVGLWLPQTQWVHCCVQGAPDSSQSSAQQSAPDSQLAVSTMAWCTAGAARHSHATASARARGSSLGRENRDTQDDVPQHGTHLEAPSPGVVGVLGVKSLPPRPETRG